MTYFNISYNIKKYIFMYRSLLKSVKREQENKGTDKEPRTFCFINLKISD